MRLVPIATTAPAARGLRDSQRSEAMAVCAYCGQDAPDTAGACPRCGRPRDAVPYANAAAPDGVQHAAWQRERQVAVWSQPTHARPGAGLVGGHLTIRQISATGTLYQAEEYELELTERDILIGRAPSSDVLLADDPLVSRRHAMLHYNDGRYTLVDLGSSNGTYVNDLEVRVEIELHDGDQLFVGHYAILVSSAAPHANASGMGSRATAPLLLLPLSYTDPHLKAVGETGDTPAAPGAPGLPYAEEPAARPLLGYVAGPAPSSPADETDPRVFSSSPHVALQPQTPTTTTPVPVASYSRDLGALQNQLTDIMHALRQQAEEDAAAAAQLRQVLVDVRETLANLMASHLEPADAAFSLKVDGLVEMARCSAEHPYNIDHLLTLSQHAEELVLVLEAVQRLQSTGGVLATVKSLRSRVEQALK
jgi:hypothetical protein